MLGGSTYSITGLLISNALTIDPSALLIIKITGMYGELDFVAKRIKFYDKLPIADINSTVSI